MPKPAVGSDGAMDSPSRHPEKTIVTEAEAPASVASLPNGYDGVAGVEPATLVDNNGLVESEETNGADDAIGSAECDATEETASSDSGGSERIHRRVRKPNARGDRQSAKPKPAKTKLVSLSEADKGLADLFQLGEENRQLRRLLVVKLRKDNDWLRDRLRRA